jgi:protein-L-isoaspartate(D-aspartate) O-methyltransferase
MSAFTPDCGPRPPTAMNTDQARFNMVEQQIRPWNVLDPKVLDLLFEVKREEFVPEAYRGLAFMDLEIPLGKGEVMMSPKVEARLLQELDPKTSDRVLEVGTGSGYLTALLARRAAEVLSIEIHDDFWHRAATNLERAGIRNLQLKVGDAARTPAGFVAASERFDAIVLTGSVAAMPAAYLDRLAPGGRAIAIVGEAPIMHAMLFTHVANGQFHSRELFETVLPPLVNAIPADHFEF